MDRFLKMDAAGDEAAHAAKNIEKIEEQQIAEEPIATTDVVGEKKELEHSSSDSSSDAETSKLDKLDSRIIDLKGTEAEDPYAHLPENERAIVKRQLDVPTVTVTFKTLYRYATVNDIIIIIISSLAAIVGGAAMPLMTVRLLQRC